MKKLVSVVGAALAAFQMFGGQVLAVGEAGKESPSNTPHIVKQVRSPLGKEIDSLRLRCNMIDQINAEVFKDMYSRMTNLAARVEALEAAEAERAAKQAEIKARAAERKQAIDKREEQRKLLEAAKARAAGLKRKEAAKATKEGK